MGDCDFYGGGFLGGAGISLIGPHITNLFGSAFFLNSSDRPSVGMGYSLSSNANLISSTSYDAFY